MKLAVVFGARSADIIDRLRSVQDNLVIDGFNTVEDMITSSKTRAYFYDRIIVLSKVVRTNGVEQSIDALYTYWKAYTQRTQIVMLCKSGADDDVAKFFTSEFASPMVTSMSTPSSTMKTLTEAACADIRELNTKYGIKYQFDVDVDEEVLDTTQVVEEQSVAEVPETPTQQNVVQEAQVEEEVIEETIEVPTAQPAQTEQPAKQEGKKKGGFFGKVFGGKKNKNKDNTTAPAVTLGTESSVGQMPNTAPNISMPMGDMSMGDMSMDDMSMDDMSMGDMSMGDMSMGDMSMDGMSMDGMSMNGMSMGDMSMGDMPMGDMSMGDMSMDGMPMGDMSMGDISMGDMSMGDMSMEDTSMGGMPMGDMPMGDMSMDGMSMNDTAMEDTSMDGMSMNDTVMGDTFMPANMNDTVDESENTEDEDFSVPSMGTSVQQVVAEDEDFGNIELPQTPTQPEQRQRRNVRQPIKPVQNQSVVADDDFGDMSVGDLEATYRKKVEEPKVKVVTKEVVKEVVKEVKVGGGSNSVYGSILKGRTQKIILVTGDRGSGVTSLAYDIALWFSKYVNVLYFDGDTELHGLLSYIEYDDFCNYDASQQQGVKLCRSAKAFPNCIVRLDTNLDILTCNYGVEVTDDELANTQSVVAEVSPNYGITVVDVPISKLPLFTDLILAGNVCLCVEANKRGFMNAICQLENSSLPVRYKRNISGTGTMVYTKINPKINMKKLLKYVDSIVDFEEVNWLGMHAVNREAKLKQDFIEDILEG